MYQLANNGNTSFFNFQALKSLEKNGKATKKASGHKVEEHKAYKGDKSKKQAHDKLIKFGKKHQKPEDKHKYKYSQVLH